MKIIKTKILPLFLCVVLVATLSLAPKQEAQAVAVSTTIAVVSAVLLSLGLAVNYSDLLGHEPSTEADVQTVLSAIGTSMNLHDNGLGGMFIALVSGVVKGTITIAQATWQRLKSWAGSSEAQTLVADVPNEFNSDSALITYLNNLGYNYMNQQKINTLRQGCVSGAKISALDVGNDYLVLYCPRDLQEVHFVGLKMDSWKKCVVNDNFTNCYGSEFYNSVKNKLANEPNNPDALFSVYKRSETMYYYFNPLIIQEATPINTLMIKKGDNTAVSRNDRTIGYTYFMGTGLYYQNIANSNTATSYGYTDNITNPYGGSSIIRLSPLGNFLEIQSRDVSAQPVISNGIIMDERPSTIINQYFPLLSNGTFDVITSGRTAKPIIDAPTDGTAPVYRIDGDVKITIPDDIVMKEAVKQVVNGTKSVTETLPLIDVIPIDTALDKTITIPTTDTDVLYPSIPTTKEEVVTVPITIEQAITVTQKMPSSYTFDLRDLFPFCLPFDLYNLYKVFQAEPVAPSFDWDLPVGYENGEVQFETYTINLNIFDEVAYWVRRLELIAFIVGLIYVTRDKFIRS